MSFHISGLGLIERTKTGIRDVSEMSCLPDQATKDMWLAACRRDMSIRGLGAVREKTEACKLADLDVCPTPGCIDLDSAALLFKCIDKTASPTLKQFCATPAGQALLKKKYCKPLDQRHLPPCLDRIWKDGIAYCKKHGSTGPDPKANALCWANMKDAAYWKALQKVYDCQLPKTVLVPTCKKDEVLKAGKCVKKPIACKPGFVVKNGKCVALPKRPKAPTADEPKPVFVEPDVPEPESVIHEESSAGVWGILLLLAAVGGGTYYAVTRKKKS